MRVFFTQSMKQSFPSILMGRLCVTIIVIGLALGLTPAIADELSATEKSGLAVYKSANCMGCHKWHGQGGGGYGGRAFSLRKSPMNEAGLALIIKCGRPATGMPYHGRKAYATEEDTGCYGQPRASLGKNMPSRARKLLSDRQIDAVVHYVVNRLQGRGAPTYEECEQFWGKGKRQCDEFK